MHLLSVEELSKELSISSEYLRELIAKKIIIPYGGRARLGEPRFSSKNLPDIRNKLKQISPL